MAARRYDPEATRAAILEAAHRIFVERGTADAPLSEIAKASGVTKSLIHHHFGSKDELWQEVKKAAFQPFFENILEIIRGDRDHLATMEAAIRWMFGYFQAHPDIARMMTWMRLEHGEVCLDLEQMVTVEGIGRIAEAQAAGEVRPDLRPESIQLIFVIATTGWFQMRHLAEHWPDADPQALEDRYLEDFVNLFLKGVRP